MGMIRTDLALEAHELAGSAPGVESEETLREGWPLTTVRVTSAQGAGAIGKPEGVYHTLDLAALAKREEKAFPRAVEARYWWWAWATAPSPPTPSAPAPPTALW